MSGGLRGRACVVAVAESDLGEVGPYLTAADLMAQALDRALAECGLAKADVDGLFSSSAYYQMASVEAAEYLGVVGGDGPGDVEPGEREGGGEQNGYVPELERGQEVEFEDADGISDEFEEAAGREGATGKIGAGIAGFRHR